MILFRLALRNVLRHRRRTILTCLIIAAGFLALSLAGGFMAQSFRGLAESSIRSGLGHIQILDRRLLEADESASLGFALTDGEGLARQLRRDPAVAEVLPRIQFMGLISQGPTSVPFLATAVDPGLEAQYMGTRELLCQGHWMTQPREILLGIGLAKSLKVQPGEEITLMATTREGALNAQDLLVVGLLDYGLKEMNDRFALMPLGAAEDLLQAQGARSRLAILLKDPKGLDAQLRRISAHLQPGTIAVPWTRLAPFYGQVRMLYVAIFGGMGAVLLLVVLLATANTLYMSVMERMREFGTLRAMGLEPFSLLALLQWEGALLGILGSMSGLLLTLIVRSLLNALHLQLPPPPGVSHGYELNIHFVPLVYGLSWIGLQFTLQMSALLPGLKAARLQIVQALRLS